MTLRSRPKLDALYAPCSVSGDSKTKTKTTLRSMPAPVSDILKESSAVKLSYVNGTSGTQTSPKHFYKASLMTNWLNSPANLSEKLTFTYRHGVFQFCRKCMVGNHLTLPRKSYIVLSQALAAAMHLDVSLLSWPRSRRKSAR